MTGQPAPSSPRTAHLWSLLRTELAYQYRSRHLLFVGAVFLLTTAAAGVGLVSRAGAKFRLFQSTLEESARNGITLKDALSQAVTVSHDAQGETVNNILRFDYDTARTAIGSLTPMGFAVNTLQLLSFVILPAVCVVMGIVLATRDYRFATIKVRSVRWSLGPAQAAQLLSCVSVAVVGVLGSVLVSMVAAPLARAWFLRQQPASVADLPLTGPGPGELMATIGLLLAVIVFFSCLGIALGLLFRKALAPALIFIVWNTMCPMLGSWDPRTLWSSLAHRVFHFEGVFTLTPAPVIAPLIVITVLAAIAATFVIAGHLVSTRTSRFI